MPQHNMWASASVAIIYKGLYRCSPWHELLWHIIMTTGRLWRSAHATRVRWDKSRFGVAASGPASPLIKIPHRTVPVSPCYYVYGLTRYTANRRRERHDSTLSKTLEWIFTAILHVGSSYSSADTVRTHCEQ